MKVYNDIKDFNEVKNPVLTTGTFDGVHQGHQKVLNHLSTLANGIWGETVMLTFHPHPRKVVFDDYGDLKLLTPLEEKIKLLETFGVEHLIVYPFTKEFSRMTSEEYVRDLLVNKIGVKKVVVGYDHRFGRNREGDFSTLVEMAGMFNFDVEEIPAKDIDQINVSSTKIRTALLHGDVSIASKYLGYDYSITGTVIRGNKIGRSIGFPTANLSVENQLKLIPGHGVYFIVAELNGKTFNGMLNVGRRPTLSDDSGTTTIEAHLFNFEEEIYNSTLKITFKERIRDEAKFDSLDELKLQLEKDRQKVLSLFR